MNTLAIFLVLSSAVLHSVWNLLAKKSRNKIIFNGYMNLLTVIIYFPLFVYLIISHPIPLKGWLFIGMSGTFIATYYYFLGKTYSYGDFSLTYPITRSSTLFVPFLAFFLINERLSWIGIFGIGIILGGIYLLSYDYANPSTHITKMLKNKALLFSVLVALFSAFYSITDKVGVNYVSPFVYLYLILVVSIALYTPIMLTRSNRISLKMEWRANHKNIISAAILVMLSYLLILFAFQLEQVSYVIAMRQSSVIFGVILGTLVLKEKHGKTRLLASIIMLIGFYLVSIA